MGEDCVRINDRWSIFALASRYNYEVSWYSWQQPASRRFLMALANLDRLVIRDALPVMPPPPPPGLNYIAPIRIAVRDLLIAHTFSILLVSLLISLLYFSTNRSRRQPIFWLNVFTILLALSVGGLIDYQTVRSFLRLCGQNSQHRLCRYKR